MIEKLVNEVISAIYHDSERIVFLYGKNQHLEMFAEGDCCSRSWIESVEFIPGSIGSKVVQIFNDDIGAIEDPNHECLQVYKTIIRTLHGDITIDFRNSSNGYYGGSLQEKEFEPTRIPKLLVYIDPEKVLKELI